MSWETRAIIQADFLQDKVRLLVAQPGPDRSSDVLLEDGTWQRVEQGQALPSHAGILLYPEAVEAIARACNEHLGNSVPTKAEVSVLREWLAVERNRVDWHLTAHLSEADHA